MNTAVSSSNMGVKRGRFAIAALLAFCALAMAWSASGAKADQGDPFAVDFNYVGLNVDASLAEINQLVLDPTTEDSEGNVLGALEVRGTYDDDDGNFTLPKEDGLEFPQAVLDIEGAQITGNLGLVEDAHGTYDSTSGAMTLNPKISLTLGSPNARDFPEELLAIIGGMLPSGDAPYPIACEFAPLDAELSTSTGWPAPGTPFANAEDPLPSEGAISGAWRSKPDVKAISGGAVCDLIGTLIKDVGGLWLANSSTPYEAMPDATAPKPAPRSCQETGKVGIFPACTDPIPETDPCPAGTTGTQPNCVPDAVDPVKTPFAVGKVAVSPGKASVKAGKSVKLKVSVTNSGQTDGSATVSLKSTNKKVTLPKSIKVSVAAGKTVVKTVVVKVSKKAKGKATITAKSGSKSGKSVLTVKKAKKAKKAKK